MRTIFVASTLLVISMPSIAAATCAEVPMGPLASEKKEKAHKPINEVVEALLSDAETIYTEGAHIVERKPRTDSESLAISRMTSSTTLERASTPRNVTFNKRTVLPWMTMTTATR